MSDVTIQGQPGLLSAAGLQAHVAVHSPIGDDHRYFARIGRITASWAQFERILEIAIWELSGKDQATASKETAELLGPKVRFALLRKKLKAVGKLEMHRETVDALEVEAQQTAKQRNRITHDPWYLDGNGDVHQWTQDSARKNLTFGFHPVDEADLVLLQERTSRLVDNAWKVRGLLLAPRR